MSDYLPIPVLAAKDLADTYDKDVVVIAGWNHEHALLHVATYGKAPADKVSAARAGEMVSEKLGMINELATFNEDFRQHGNTAKQKAMEEAIEKHLPALKKMAGQVIHPTENTFSKMVRDFEKAMQ